MISEKIPLEFCAESPPQMGCSRCPELIQRRRSTVAALYLLLLVAVAQIPAGSTSSSSNSSNSSEINNSSNSNRTQVLECGNCTWYRETNGTLTIQGSPDCGSTCPTTLDFVRKKIKSIGNGAFNRSNLSHVATLYLYDNEIETIQSGAFEGMETLWQVLALDGNRISTLEDGCFKELGKVQAMYLYGNQLNGTPSTGVFQGLDSLWLLHIASNGISYVPPRAFSNLTNLKYLWLDSNGLSQVPAPEAFAGTKLNTLYIRNNNIAKVRAGAFSGPGLSSLDKLGLNNNAIYEIEDGGFRGLGNLKTLDLAKNQITTVTKKTFSDVVSLVDLNLEDNNIKNFTGAFDGLVNLEKINLQGNPLVCKSEMNVTVDSSDFLVQPDYLSLPDCIPSVELEATTTTPAPSSEVEASPVPEPSTPGTHAVEMAVRIEGTAASFDGAKRQQFLAAMRRASPSALNVTIMSVTEMSSGRRRLLAPYLDVGLEFIYWDEASAKSAAERDLAESNLNGIMMGAGLGTLAVTSEPTVRLVGQGPAVADASTPTWVIIVASLGGALAVGLIGVCAWYFAQGCLLNVGLASNSIILKHENPMFDDKELQDFIDTVLSRDPVFETKFTEEARDIIMGKAKAAAEGLETLLCVDSKETFYRRISREVAGIEEEVKQFIDENANWREGQEISSQDVGEVQEMFHYIMYEGTSEKKYPNGIRDQGRPPGTRLDYFVSHPKAVEAGLSAAHVVALRMYTSSIYTHLNAPLRDMARKDNRVACELPVTTWFATEGIKKLRTLHAPLDGDPVSDLPLAGISANFEPEPSGGSKVEGGAPLKVEQNPGSGGQPSDLGKSTVIGNATPEDVEISNLADTPTLPSSNLGSGTVSGVDSAQNIQSSRMPSEGVTLWRGLRNTNVTDAFTQVGGTELAFMSTTTNIYIAVKHSMSPDSLLFKIVNDSFMSIGADINWLSTFPGEGEFLYPPLTYLKPTGRSASGISIKKGREVLNFTVVEVKPYLG